jgi:uncharacterized membrane protein
MIPQGAERIMRMCEEEQAARLHREKWATYIEVGCELGGRFFGAFLVLCCILAAVWTVYVKAPWQTTLIFLGLPVMGALKTLLERNQPR